MNVIQSPRGARAARQSASLVLATALGLALAGCASGARDDGRDIVAERFAKMPAQDDVVAAGDWYRPDRWPEFRYYHFALCFVVVPAVAYFVAWMPITGFSISGFVEAQRRIFTENSAVHPPHLYMSSWPSWPLLMRPIWYQFDKVADDRFQAVVFLGNPLILWPALAALLICARDFIVARRMQAFLILAFYLGPWLAWATLPRTIGFIYYYLPAATVASLALVYVLTQGERAPPRANEWQR